MGKRSLTVAIVKPECLFEADVTDRYITILNGKLSRNSHCGNYVIPELLFPLNEKIESHVLIGIC